MNPRALEAADLEDMIDGEIVPDETVGIDTEPVSDRQQLLNEHKQFIRYLELHPEVEIPYSYDTVKLWCLSGGNEVERAAHIVKSIGGRWAKNNPKASDFDESNLVMTRKLDRKLTLQVLVSRGNVCDRKVVGKKIKSVAVTTYVNKEVDDVEFECGSLLTAAQKIAMDKLEAAAA